MGFVVYDEDFCCDWIVSWECKSSLIGWFFYGGKEYFEISSSVWKFIQEHIIDKRPGGEWHSQIDDNWKPADFKPMVDPWKCPYHNGRMCMEMMRRLAENAVVGLYYIQT